MRNFNYKTKISTDSCIIVTGKTCVGKTYSIKKICIHYHHGIVKGKWFYSVLNKLKTEGYKFDKMNKQMSIYESLQIKFKIFIYEFFLKFLPLNIILMIENIRKNNIYK